MGFAQIMESHADELVARLCERRSEFPTAIAENSEAWEQFRNHARTLFTMIVASAASPNRTMTRHPATLVVATQRAEQQIHPRDSLAAAQLLSEAILDLAEELLGERAGTMRFLSYELPLACLRVFNMTLYASSAEHLAALLETLSESQTVERRRISRELHDDTGHGLAVAQRQIELAKRLFEREDSSPEGMVALNAALESLTTTMGALRGVLAGLRSAEDVSTLEDSLTKLVRQSPSPAAISVNISGDENAVPSAIRREVFMIIREAVRNAQRHAIAESITVRVQIKPSLLTAQISDNGSGIRPDAEPGGGMASLRQRVDLLGGRIDWLPEEPSGTQVVLTTPLPM